MFKYPKIILGPKNGFSPIELIIVMGMSFILFGFVGMNIIRFQGNSSAQANTNSMISDIKNQQIKAMLGSTEGRSVNDSYGIHFLSNGYVLFHGTTYNSSATDNFTVQLPDDLAISGTTFPDNTIIFNKLSGDILGYVSGSNTVTINAANINQQTVITFNRYGVITDVSN